MITILMLMRSSLFRSLIRKGERSRLTASVTLTNRARRDAMGAEFTLTFRGATLTATEVVCKWCSISLRYRSCMHSITSIFNDPSTWRESIIFIFYLIDHNKCILCTTCNKMHCCPLISYFHNLLLRKSIQDKHIVFVVQRRDVKVC